MTRYDIDEGTSLQAAATMEHIQRSIHDVLDIHRKQVSKLCSAQNHPE
jgi:hypothetical protein